MNKQIEFGVLISAIYLEFSRVVRDSSYDVQRIEEMYAHPAQIELAEKHKRANQFGYIRKLSEGQVDILCPCCELSVNKQDVNLCYPTTPDQDFIKYKKSDKPYQLNAGTSMFFTFIKMTIMYLTLRFFITDCYNLITNILGQNCYDPKNFQDCRSNFAAKFSNYNKNTDTDQLSVFFVDVLNFVTVLFSMYFFTQYRKYQLRIFRFAGISNHSQADYTIFVEQIPILFLKQQGMNELADCNYKTRLKQLFQKQIDQWLDAIENKNTEFFKNDIKLNQMQTAMYEIYKQIVDFRKKHPIKVKSINLCYDLTQLEKLINLRSELIQKHNDNHSKTQTNQKASQQIPNQIKPSEQIPKQGKQQEPKMKPQDSQKYFLKQIKAVNDQILRLTRRFSEQNSPQFNTSHFLGKAFISFQFQHYKQYFLEYLNKDIRFKDLDEALKITPAAQPTDIYWYNMNVTTGQRRWSVFWSYFIMALLLILSFGILLLLQYLKLLQSKNSSSTSEQKTAAQIRNGYAFTFIITGITTAINYGLGKIIEKLTEFERQMTKTDEIISLIVKTVIAQFLNTAIIYYIISLIANIFLFDDIESPLGENGLVMNITSLIAVSGAIQICTNFVQFGEIFNSICNCCKYSKQNTVNLFQVELNKAIQPTEFSFAMRYAYYILNVFVVSFYSYIVPYTSLILIVIFAIQYWVDKYNLFKRFSCPTDFNYRLSMFTLKIFECSIFFFALGNLLFAPTIHTNTHGSDYRIINIVSVSLAFVYCLAIFFLPKKFIQNFTGVELYNVSYSQCMKITPFSKFYQLQNPATSFAKEPIQKKNQEGQQINISHLRKSNFLKASNLQQIKDTMKKNTNELKP